jgi:hypothetical protein
MVRPEMNHDSSMSSKSGESVVSVTVIDPLCWFVHLPTSINGAAALFHLFQCLLPNIAGLGCLVLHSHSHVASIQTLNCILCSSTVRALRI